MSLKDRALQLVLNKRTINLAYSYKKEAKPIRRFSFYLVLILLLSGCIRTENVVQVHNDTGADDEKIEEVIVTNSSLISAVAIFHDKDLVTALNLKTFSRFKKEKIEEEVKKDLEKQYPEYKVTVSADHKILRETTKLLHEEEGEKVAEKLKELKSLLEEET